MNIKLYDEALKYLSIGWSVFPVNKKKKPTIKEWKPYQQRLATKEELNGWFKNKSVTGIAVATGRFSNVCVIDIDDMECIDTVFGLLPSKHFPISYTPSGGMHIFFAFPKKTIRNNANVIKGADFRGEGGYVVLPPSINGDEGCYSWDMESNISNTAMIPLPKAYAEYVNEHDRYKEPPIELAGHEHKEFFITGKTKDDDMFHLATLLTTPTHVKDMSFANDVMQRVGTTIGWTSTQVDEKLGSAFSRVARHTSNYTEEINEWVSLASGYFTMNDLYSDLNYTSKNDKDCARQAIKRMCEKGTVEKSGSNVRQFRSVNVECEEIDFANASTETLDIKWPLGIEKYYRTFAKSISLIAGSPDGGKSAFMFNLIEMNMKKHKINYFSSEMGASELRDRLSNFDRPIDSWRFKAIERSNNFSDVIQPNEVNIIDYLEIHDNFSQIGQHLKDIFDKLNDGIAIVAIQKKKDNEVYKYDLGRGAEFSLEKPRLYLSLGGGKAKIIKCKNWVDNVNPNGLQCEFKLTQGYKFFIWEDWK